LSRTVKLLFAFALLFLVLRWIRPGETTYTLDEPYQQLTIDSHLAAGNIPLSNSRGSSIPVPYGPGVLWFWMLVRLFTWNPIAIVLENLALQTLGFLLFAQTFRRAFGNEAAAWCVALAACSPLLFLFARHPWDPTFLIPLSAILIWLLQKLDDGGRELPLHAALGFVGGYGVNTHLMFGAVFLALGLTLLIRDARLHGWRAWRPLAVFSFSALAILTECSSCWRTPASSRWMREP
jgi:4-amino-4-deoxy-L-arabinose transferase-like glycosyltransferase